MRLFTWIVMMGLAAPVSAQDVQRGEALYQFYCATCHGTAATGNGPMSPSLVVPPVDLTQLTAGNGGVFPVSRIIARIDGRDPLVSHGSAMPVYGDFFEGRDVAAKAETGQPIMTSQPIVDLLAYLEALQG
ncbi:cytochrome c [Yoonia sp.]|uniref:c-type cytochrome n=1 Tax=Yoonia sp. TaxID=2212373 RepID=UPI0025F32767|nr:cytochrome c [Yoonia sp.]